MSNHSRGPFMVRPEWDAFYRATSGGYLACSCGRILQTLEAVREHWQGGHFDVVWRCTECREPGLPSVMIPGCCTACANKRRGFENYRPYVIKRTAPDLARQHPVSQMEGVG